MLINAGAKVTGFALAPENELSFFRIADIENNQFYNFPVSDL